MTTRKRSSTRRAFLAKTGALAASAALAPLGSLFAARKRADSYVLLIVADALRADRLGCYGYRREVDGTERSITPVMDSLAESGILYENCISQSNWTQTSVASLSHSAWPVIKGDSHTFDYIPSDSRALEKALPGFTRLGLNTNPYLNIDIYTDQFDNWRFVREQTYAPAKQMNDEFDWVATPVIQKGAPVFCYIHYMDPHEPYDMQHRFRGVFTDPEWSYSHPSYINRMLARYRDETGRVLESELPPEITFKLKGTSNAYDEDLMYFDFFLDELLRLLDYQGIRDRTTLILTADHGQGMNEHGWCGHKVTLYQEEIHVPLIITGPALPAAVRVKAQVRSVDILPTIAALSGVSPAGFVGAPLLPPAKVEAAGNRLAYSCCDYARYTDPEFLLTCLVTPERRKYIRICSKQREFLRHELYDLAADPAEKTDLSTVGPELLAELSLQMDAFESAAFWHPRGAAAPEMDKATEQQLKSLGYL